MESYPNHVVMVGGIIQLLNVDNYTHHSIMMPYISSIYKRFNIVVYGIDKTLAPEPITRMYQSLNLLSLCDLRNFLYLLIPAIYHVDNGSEVSMIKQIKLAIKFIESEIQCLTADKLKNKIDLININQQLKNENDKLKDEIAAIRKIISGSQ